MKIRFVFDTSCKGYNVVSLNEELLAGPVLQDDLRSLQDNLEKMYRMILVAQEDTDYQRILWRSDSSETIQDLRLLAVTFGTASALYLAITTLMQHANDEVAKYSEAARL